MKPLLLTFLLWTTLQGIAQTAESRHDSLRCTIQVNKRDWSWEIILQNLSRGQPARLIKPGFQTSTHWSLFDSARIKIERTCLSIDHYFPKGYNPYINIPPAGEKRITSQSFESLDKLFCKIDSAGFLEFSYGSILTYSGLLAH